MPTEVIATIHQLAATCKKYKGIVFTDKDGNIVYDINDDEYADNNTLEITGVDTTQMETKAETEIMGNNNTGVDNNNTFATEIVGNNTTGVDNDNIGTNNGLHTQE